MNRKRAAYSLAGQLAGWRVYRWSRCRALAYPPKIRKSYDFVNKDSGTVCRPGPHKAWALIAAELMRYGGRADV